MVRAQLGVFITSKVCRNAESLVMKKTEEKFREDFKVLNNYALELQATNPGSSVLVVAEKVNHNEFPVFQKMYIYLAAVGEGVLVGCRQIIGVDGCFLKGLLKGQLLMVVGRDGNNQMFPLAWAVVEKETTETWAWFFENLMIDLGMGEGLGWSLISDMQKGLIHAVKDLLPFIEHRMCARHIYARWGKKHQGKELQLQFWNVAISTSIPEMKKHLDQMRKMKGGDNAVEELLEKWPVQGWCQACFNDQVKCEVIDNNLCETFNGVVLDVRSRPVISMLETIRQYVMMRIAVKKDYASRWAGDYGPNVAAMIEKEREAYVITLAEQTCSCGKWSKTGIPCQHSMAAIAFQGEDPTNYITHWFRKETYEKAYQFAVNPVKGRDFWPVSDEGPLLPPFVKRMPDRANYNSTCPKRTKRTNASDTTSNISETSIQNKNVDVTIKGRKKYSAGMPPIQVLRIGLAELLISYKLIPANSFKTCTEFFTLAC
ncbi:uncharacterized protein LOC120268592 [Dioscorea cayenensis subsp. rotundata]|uniref:Uncharacterized protein LOC120268592 n=1 Tax=Dioscorea cayennensis subsp. rotundata TaxID=55577 RepID=A0AB40BYA0_DIOCR|nr:uncharacterized protein LOC120268592 [Dioscorea cayenensis subsp. rotundata]